MQRLFIESRIFQKFAEALPREFLRNLQNLILKEPKAGDVARGLGGIRKIRMVKRGVGKSGGYRILYLDFPKSRVCFLLFAYEKAQQEILSSEEMKEAQKLVHRLKQEMRDEKN